MVQKRARKRICAALNRYPLILQDNAFLLGSELRDLRLQLRPRAQPLVLQYIRYAHRPAHRCTTHATAQHNAAEPTETGRAHHGRLRPARIASCTARELSPCRRGYHVGWDTLLRVLADCTGHSIRHSDGRGAPPSTGQDLSCTNKCVYVAIHIACCVRCCKPRCMLCAMLHATLRVVCDVACHVACCPACKNDCLTIIEGSASSSRSMFSSMLYLQVNRQTACGVWHERRCAEQAGPGTAAGWAHPKWKDEFIGSVAPFIMFFATSGSCRRP